MEKLDIYKNFELSTAVNREICETVKTFLHLNGAVLMHRDDDTLFYHAPCTLFPTPIPRDLYEEVTITQKFFQILCHKASLDNQFIEESLKQVIVHDEFTRRLYNIHQQVQKEGVKQKLQCIISRSDYMLNIESDDTYTLKQVEINLIAAGMGTLCNIISECHRHVADELGSLSPIRRDLIPENKIKKCAIGLAKTFHLYNNENAIVVLVRLERERNKIDQKDLITMFQNTAKEIGLKKHIRVVWRTLGYIAEHGKLTKDHKFLLDDEEVAIFYFRSAYSPETYVTEKDWEARLLMEQSTAVKIPTVTLQLINTKKVQQIFSLPGVIERFVSDPNMIQRMRQTFTGLYTLDPGPEGDATEKKALEEPQRFVLKPQREGGGNNAYGDAIPITLSKCADTNERSQYILMDRIQSPPLKNFFVNPVEIEAVKVNSINEFGFFGVYVYDGENAVMNEDCGYLVRVKPEGSDEGGVTAGFGSITSPYLI